MIIKIVFYSIQIFVILVFNIMLWLNPKKKNEFCKIINLISLIILMNAISQIINIATLDKYKILFEIVVTLVFFLISCYIMFILTQKYTKIIDALKNLSNKKINKDITLKEKGNFKELITYYNIIHDNFSVLIHNLYKLTNEIQRFSTNFQQKSITFTKIINELDKITSNLNSSVDILCRSAEITAAGLMETRERYSDNAEKFKILFEKINNLFSQNINMQQENENMEKFSISAIKFSIDLNDITKKGTTKIDKIIGFIESFGQSVKKIIDMVNLIKKITRQTNLLAMNASIEAAHAGKAGQGFGVVANEIRVLSESSNLATKQITEIVNSISEELKNDQQNSKKAKEGIQEITDAFSKNINFINMLADSINQQIDSVDLMKENIEEIHELSKKINSSAQEQQKKTQDIYEATETLNSQTFLINQLIIQQKNVIDEVIVDLKKLDEVLIDYDVIKNIPYSINQYHTDLESENIDEI